MKQLATVSFIFFFAIYCSTAGLAQVTPAYVSDSASLLAALQNQGVGQILLVKNVTVGSEFSQYVGQPIPISRNVTISGPPGANPLLNLNRQTGVVQLCASCTLQLVNISIANSTKHGTGYLTFFRGQIGSRIEQQNGYNVRLVCSSTAAEIAVANSTQRSALFPSPQGGRQLTTTTNVTYLGSRFQNNLNSVDVSFDVPLTLVTAGVFAGGFAMRIVNVTRLCWSYVSDACVAKESPEVCVSDQLAQLLAAETPQQQAGSYPPGKVAAIAVPVSVVGALLVGAAVLLLLRRRKRRRNAAQQDRLDPDSKQKSKNADLQVVVHSPFGPADPRGPAPGAAAAVAALGGSADVGNSVTKHGTKGCGFNSSSYFSPVGVSPITATVPGMPSAASGCSASPAPAAAGAGRDPTEHSGSISFAHHTGSTVQNGHSAPSAGLQSSQLHSSASLHPGSGPPGVTAMAPLAAGTTSDWRLTSSHVNPALQAAANAAGNTIEWGELLGAGSFGRVYKCRWAGMDVAVKVIQHDSSALAAVENEVQLQMYLQHPNIVRAFHYVTHTHKPTSASSAISSARTGGGLAASIMTRSTLNTALTTMGKRQSGTANACASNLQQQQQQQQRRPHLALQLQPQQQGQRAGDVGQGQAAVELQLQKEQQDRKQQQLLQHDMQHSLVLPNTPAGQQRYALQRMASPESFTLSSAAAAATSSTLSSSLAGSGMFSSTAPRFETEGSSIHHCSAPPAVAAAGAASDQLDDAGKQHMVTFIPTVVSSVGLNANAKQAESAVAGLAAMGSSNRDKIAVAPAAEAEGVSSSEDNSNSSSGKRAASGGGNSTGDEQLVPPLGWPILLLNSSSGTGALHDARRTAGATAAAAGASGVSSGLRMTGRGRPTLDKKAFRSAEISETWLVQELCDCGTLASIAASYWSRDTEDDMQMLQRLLLLQDVVRGLEFLHSKNIVHSDLNANNVLVSSSDTSMNGLTAKLADLGLSRVINQQRSHRTTHTFGTLSHMPPCLLREGRLSTRADIYALGVMMWELYTGEPAWQGLHYGQFFQQVVLEHSRPAVPDDMPEDYTCLMTHCWAEDPNDRPTAGVVLHCLQLMVQERLKVLGVTLSDAAEGAQDLDGPTTEGQLAALLQ